MRPETTAAAAAVLVLQVVLIVAWLAYLTTARGELRGGFWLFTFATFGLWGLLLCALCTGRVTG